jgi:hypothetical protein
MLNPNDLPINGKQYTHIGDDGVTYAYFVDPILNWCKKNKELTIIAPERRVAEQIVSAGSISFEKLFRLLHYIIVKNEVQPILIVKLDSGLHLLIDGNHRYYLAVQTSLTLTGYILTESEAEQFRIDIQLTKEILDKMPIA